MENSTPKCMSTWGNKDKPLHFWASFLNMQCSRCALAYQHSGQPGFQLSRVAGFQLRFQGSRPVQKDAGRADQNIDGGVMQVTFSFGLGLAVTVGNMSCHVGLFEDCDDCDAPSSGVTMFFPTAESCWNMTWYLDLRGLILRCLRFQT